MTGPDHTSGRRVTAHTSDPDTSGARGDRMSDAQTTPQHRAHTPVRRLDRLVLAAAAAALLAGGVLGFALTWRWLL